MSTPFIIHTPTSIHKLELLVLDELFNLYDKFVHVKVTKNHHQGNIVFLNYCLNSIRIFKHIITYDVLCLITLLFPPSSEECHLNIDERSVLVNL